MFNIHSIAMVMEHNTDTNSIDTNITGTTNNEAKQKDMKKFISNCLKKHNYNFWKDIEFDTSDNIDYTNIYLLYKLGAKFPTKHSLEMLLASYYYVIANKDYALAEAVLSTLIERQDKYLVLAEFCKAGILINMGKNDEGIILYERLARKKVSNLMMREIYLNMSTGYHNKSDKPSRINCLEKAAEYGSGKAMYLLGIIYRFEYDYYKMMKYLTLAGLKGQKCPNTLTIDAHLDSIITGNCTFYKEIIDENLNLKKENEVLKERIKILENNKYECSDKILAKKVL